MIEHLYRFLAESGYHHPLHPPLTHLPVGLSIGAFVFIVLAWLLRQPGFGQTARHCVVLAFLASIPTALAGVSDWQYFYGGALVFPIQVKLVLAAVLVFLLLALSWNSLKRKEATFFRLFGHLLSLLIVVSLGYFGGELVYVKNPEALPSARQTPANNASAAAGAALFDKKCAACHLAGSTDAKVGPGLKGLFERVRMPASGRPASVESFRQQLKHPVGQMPAFSDLEEREIQQLTDYLKSL